MREWLKANAESLGRRYVNDVRRHFGEDKDKAVLVPEKLI